MLQVNRSSQSEGGERSPEPSPDELISRIHQGPIETWVKFGKFPWLLLIDIILVILTSFVVLSLVSTSSNDDRAHYPVWKSILLNSTADDPYREFLSLDDFQQHLVGLTKVQNCEASIYVFRF
jgi:hypothetical protein